MCHRHALEVVAYEGQVGKALVGQCPVGEHPCQRREDVQFACGSATGVCGKEGRYHHVSPVHVGRCGVALCRVSGTAQIGTARRVLATDVLSLHTLLVYRQHGAEFLERGAVVTVGGIAVAGKGRTKGNDGHVEGTCLCGGRTLVHILYAL